jgi:hypothetical protein
VLVEREVAGRLLRARCSRRNAVRARSALEAFERGSVEPGVLMRFGWSALSLQEADAALDVLEPDFEAWPHEQRWREGIDVTLDVAEAQARLLRITGSDSQDAAFDQVLLAVPRAVDLSRVFLRRVEPLAPEDSGWLLGPLDDPEALSRADELERLPLASLVARRPALLAPLALPVGFVAIVAGSSVQQVLDGAGRELL